MELILGQWFRRAESRYLLMFSWPRCNLVLSTQGRLETLRQLLGPAFAPEMGEVEGWLFTHHVVVQRHNVDTRLAQSPEYRLHFLGGHDEVAIHRRQLVATRESCPG